MKTKMKKLFLAAVLSLLPWAMARADQPGQMPGAAEITEGLGIYNAAMRGFNNTVWGEEYKNVKKVCPRNDEKAPGCEAAKARLFSGYIKAWESLDKDLERVVGKLDDGLRKLRDGSQNDQLGTGKIIHEIEVQREIYGEKLYFETKLKEMNEALKGNASTTVTGRILAQQGELQRRLLYYAERFKNNLFSPEVIQSLVDMLNAYKSTGKLILFTLRQTGAFRLTLLDLKQVCLQNGGDPKFCEEGSGDPLTMAEKMGNMITEGPHIDIIETLLPPEPEEQKPAYGAAGAETGSQECEALKSLGKPLPSSCRKAGKQ